MDVDALCTELPMMTPARRERRNEASRIGILILAEGGELCGEVDVGLGLVRGWVSERVSQ